MTRMRKVGGGEGSSGLLSDLARNCEHPRQRYSSDNFGTDFGPKGATMNPTGESLVRTRLGVESLWSYPPRNRSRRLTMPTPIARDAAV